MRIITSSQMKEAERYAYENGISGIRLMENAGAAAARFIRTTVTISGAPVVVVCGKGNNGGDGFVTARKLNENGAEVTVVLAMGEPATADAAEMLERLKGLGVLVLDYHSQSNDCVDCLKESSFIVDAIFGTGFKGAAEGEVATVIEEMNTSVSKIFALDMPSGADADTGAVGGACVRADYTISFAAPKTGQYTFPAADFCGAVRAVNIGIPEDAFESFTNSVELVEQKMVEDQIPKKPLDSNKGTFGTVLCVCGSTGMSGAAYMAATGALRCGAGLIAVYAPESIYLPLAAKFNEVMVFPLKATPEGSLSAENYDAVMARKADCLLIGCGVSRNPETAELVRRIVKDATGTLVLDADGINAMAGHIDILRDSKADIILTPHPGEMARLLGVSAGEVQNARLKTASDFAGQNGVYVVLKGANTVIATPQGKLYINPTGNPGMAKGGSGDLLAGMTASFAAQGLPPAEAAMCAVYIHGMAGDRAAAKLSQYGMVPTDILEEIPTIFHEMSR